MVQVAVEPADQPEVATLIAELDAYLEPLYPAESQHGIDLRALAQPNVVFVVARDDGGVAVGCGAVVLGSNYGEIKRMYVRPSHRGRGVGRSVLRALESAAAERGCRLLVLETGIRQPEALGLYERAGFLRCAPFGAYREDPLSVFMRKPIDPS